MESRILEFLQKEEALNAELAYGEYDSPLDEEDWIKYELKLLRDYITAYIDSDKRTAADLLPLKDFIQHQKFKKLRLRYDDYLSHDMFGETLNGHKSPNPYVHEIVESNFMEEDGRVRRITEYPDDFED